MTEIQDIRKNAVLVHSSYCNNLKKQKSKQNKNVSSQNQNLSKHIIPFNVTVSLHFIQGNLSYKILLSKYKLEM